jgi:hypothetical protein
MDWPFEQLKANAASFRQITIGVTSLATGIFIWICLIGGVTAVLKWLHRIQSQRRKEAKDKIRVGLKSAQAKVTDEDKLDSLIVGLDQWKDVAVQLRGWTRGVRVCKWSIAGMACALVLVFATNNLTTKYGIIEASFSIAWMVAMLTFFIYLTPLLLLAYNNGVPKAVPDPTPPDDAPPSPAPASAPAEKKPE